MVINVKWLVVFEIEVFQDKVNELTKFKYEIEMCDEGSILMIFRVQSLCGE